MGRQYHLPLTEKGAKMTTKNCIINDYVVPTANAQSERWIADDWSYAGHVIDTTAKAWENYRALAGQLDRGESAMRMLWQAHGEALAATSTMLAAFGEAGSAPVGDGSGVSVPPTAHHSESEAKTLKPAQTDTTVAPTMPDSDDLEVFDGYQCESCCELHEEVGCALYKCQLCDLPFSSEDDEEDVDCPECGGAADFYADYACPTCGDEEAVLVDVIRCPECCDELVLSEEWEEHWAEWHAEECDEADGRR